MSNDIKEISDEEWEALTEKVMQEDEAIFKRLAQHSLDDRARMIENLIEYSPGNPHADREDQQEGLDWNRAVIREAVRRAYLAGLERGRDIVVGAGGQDPMGVAIQVIEEEIEEIEER